MSTRRDDELPLSGQRRIDDDVRGEMEFHLEQRVRELVARGTPPDEARRIALAAFGDRESVEAECREIETRRRVAHGRARRMVDLREDVRVGARLLRRNPAYTLAATFTLALGIGANTAVFSIVNDVVLSPLAVTDADRLVTVVERHERGWGNLPWHNFLDVREQATSFDHVTAFGTYPTTVLGADRPLRVEATAISQDFFRVFPARAMLGRLPVPDEHQLGATAVAVVSHRFWRDRLGAPDDLASRSLRMDQPYQVIGVLPPDFDYPGAADVMVPLELQQQSVSRTSHTYLTVVGRLSAGRTPLAAQQELDALMGRLREQHYPDFDAVGTTVTLLVDTMSASARAPLYLLLGASGVLLLAACTNLASAGLARGTARGGELAVRAALGAGRSRLVRQLLTESALLSVLGCVAGLVVAMVILRVMLPMAPGALGVGSVSVDGTVLAFAAVIAVATTLLSGLLPALRLSDTETGGMLRSGLRGTGDARRRHAWNALVVAEVALATVLLAGSGLLIRSFSALVQVDPGFEPAGAMRTAVELPEVNYEGRSPAIPSFHDRALGMLQAEPGIEAVGFANRLPLTGSALNGAMEVEGKPHDARGAFTGSSVYRVVGGDYFEAVGIPLMEGRAFGAGDDRAGAPVVIVSATFARIQWPGEGAIGKRLRPVGMDGGAEPWHTVIGVVGDTHLNGMTDAFREVYYFDYRQRPPYRSGTTEYVARASNLAAAASTVRRVIESIDPQVPIEQRSLASLVNQSVADQRFTMIVLGAFSGVALLLAVVGIYAVVSYTVAQRTREIGVRLALGATPGTVRSMVMLSSLRSLAPGLALGVLLAVGATSVMRSMLYGVSPLDPIALGSAVFVLAIAGVMSTLPPATRATRVDPLAAIRSE